MKKIRSFFIIAAAMLLCVSGSVFVSAAEEDDGPLHEHAYGVWTVLQPAEVNVRGLRMRECACGEKDYAVIPAVTEICFRSSARTYTSRAISNPVYVVDEEGDVLKEGVDYTCLPGNNVNVGKADVTVSFMGNYASQAAAEYEIVACEHKQYSEWTVTQKATTDADGSKTRTCEFCKETQTKKIPRIASVTLGASSVRYNGKPQTVPVTVKDSEGDTLSQYTDYTLSFSDNTEAGKALVKVAFTGAYSGSVTKTFTITDCSHSFGQATRTAKATTSADGSLTRMCTVCGFVKTETIPSVASVTLEKSSVEYNGKPAVNKVTVKDRTGAVLSDGSDYTVSYENNTALYGIASAVVTFTGDYSGSVTKNFKIIHYHSYSAWKVTPATSAKAGSKTRTCSVCGDKESVKIPAASSVTLAYSSLKYTGTPRTNKVTVKDSSGKTLTAGTDYTVSYKGNGKVSGTAYAVITFKGNYTGSVEKSFKITHTHSYGEEKVLTRAAFGRSGQTEKTCPVCGKKSTKTLEPISSVTLSKKTVKYTGSAVKPSVTVKDRAGKTLKKGTDYTLSYKNNVKPGTASVTVSFTGKYSGSRTEKFTITHDHNFGGWTAVKAATTKAAGSAKRVCKGCGTAEKKTVAAIGSAALKEKEIYYSGKTVKPAVKITDKDGKTIPSEYYSLTYSSNKSIGTAKVTVEFKGLYSGKLSKSFRILPQKTSLTKVVPGSTEILLYWSKKTAGTKGYQVQYATDADFTKNVKTVRFTDNKRSVGMIYDQKPKTAYYIRIRTYAVKDKKYYYSGWSSYKKTTTKANSLHHIPGQIPQSAKAKSSYFGDVVFVGDSISLGLTYYETANDVLGKAQFLTAGSLGACNALWDVSSKSVHPRYNGVKMKLEKSIPKTGAKKIYIMLGMNDISYGLDYAFRHYKTLLNNIHKAAPDAMIYIESVTPRVNQGSNMSNPYLNNKNITAYNKKLSNLARENGWFFVNVAETMYDANGYLKRSYCGDPNGMGMHFLGAGCAAWVEYLYTHTAG